MANPVGAVPKESRRREPVEPMKQVLVQLRNDAWEVREMMAGYYALLDGEVLSLHQVTLTYEQRKQLPQEARNALALAGLRYDDEPEAAQ